MDKLQEALKKTEESLDNLDKDIAEAVSLDETGPSEYSGGKKKMPTDSTQEMLCKARTIHTLSMASIQIQIDGLESLKDNTQLAIDGIDAGLAFMGSNNDDAYE